MSVKKIDHEYTDAKGDLHKVFADGRSEIYHKGNTAMPHPADQQYMEITDDVDRSVKRKRFMPWTKQTVEEGLQVRDDPEDATVPGIDFDDDEPPATDVVNDD